MGGGPRQAVSVFFGGVMVPSFKGISRGGVKKKAVGAVLDPPPIIMESKVWFRYKSWDVCLNSSKSGVLMFMFAVCVLTLFAAI